MGMDTHRLHLCYTEATCLGPSDQVDLDSLLPGLGKMQLRLGHILLKDRACLPIQEQLGLVVCHHSKLLFSQ